MLTVEKMQGKFKDPILFRSLYFYHACKKDRSLRYISIQRFFEYHFDKRNQRKEFVTNDEWRKFHATNSEFM
jgi:hypothetical protein